jgi:hypothetical protein
VRGSGEAGAGFVPPFQQPMRRWMTVPEGRFRREQGEQSKGQGGPLLVRLQWCV